MKINFCFVLILLFYFFKSVFTNSLRTVMRQFTEPSHLIQYNKCTISSFKIKMLKSKFSNLHISFYFTLFFYSSFLNLMKILYNVERASLAQANAA